MKKAILILICFCFSSNSKAQDDIDTLQLFPDTTTFNNEGTYVTDWVSNLGVKFDLDTNWEDYEIEELLVLFINKEYPPWDTSEHSTNFNIYLELEDSSIYTQTIILDTEVYPNWKVIDISPRVVISNHSYFYITGLSFFLNLATSYYRHDTLYNNQFIYWWIFDEWREGAPHFYPIKAVVKKKKPVGVNENKNKDYRFIIYQNYPNPFNPETTLKYELNENSFVSIKLHNVLGRLAANILNQEQSRGVYEIKVNSTEYSLSPGVYFCNFLVNNRSKTIKIQLIE